MKTVYVVAGIIEKDHKILATQRGYGPFQGFWEFPGGKIEYKETPQLALIREIKEELAAEISITKFFKTISYDYPDFHLKMDCFLCSLISNDIHLLEHKAAMWLSADEFDQVTWLPADLEIIPLLRSQLLSS